MLTGYLITLERFADAWPQIEPLARRHYAEMQDRLATQGIAVAPFAPRVPTYVKANEEGRLLLFVVRLDGVAVGHSSIWLATDMHNGEFISQEDTIYIHPDHRKGVGRVLTKAILAHLKSLGVKRAHVTISTDLRVSKMCVRLGFRHAAHSMIMNL